MKKYKAKITRKNFEDFTNYYNTCKERVENALDIFAKEVQHKRDICDVAYRMFSQGFISRNEWKNTFCLEDKDNQKLKILVEYCADNNISWNVEQETEHYLFVSFSGTKMFWDKQFCTMEELPDYDGLSLGEIKAQIGSGTMADSLPMEMNTLSVNSINEEKDQLSSAKKELEKLKDDVNFARTEELKKMDEEIRKLKDALNEKKKVLMAEINEKMAALNEKVELLNNQIYMIESEIYSIRSYNGETIEFKKVRDGRKAAMDTPLVINQKLIYLDEDLARIVSIYQKEIAKQFSFLEDAIKGSNEVFESFCPQERCITFFRLSRNATYKWYNADKSMYETEELIHGKKIGFILKDGECAYMGWLDEAWRTDSEGKPVSVTFSEDLMYKPEKTKTYADEDDKKYGLDSDSKNTMLSRVFAMFVVQGILDNKGLVSFPEKVSVLQPGKYIVYNFATAWITDERFGDFATLVDNLNKRTKIKDQILICYNKNYCKGRGEVDRAHDCIVPEGINKVNFLESDDYGHCNIYVSAKKRYSYKGATANVKVSQNEYINITYMNSIWLSYYVQTKKMGAYIEDYAKMIKHFKRAIEILKERETEEMTYIKKYFAEADKIPDWEVKLSHWKLNHNIRFINDFQAKRIAKYLQEGKFEENKNLFVKEEFYHVNETADGKYGKTNFSWVSGWDKKEGVGEFEKGSPYYMQSFYLSNFNTGICLGEKDKKENELLLATELPKLEKLVPKRLKQDEKKLALVNQYVEAFMKEHNVEVTDIDECPLGLSFSNGSLNFVNVEKLAKLEKELVFECINGRYPSYILQSDCWKVAYYDFVHGQYGFLLKKVKLIIHDRFMNDTVPAEKQKE